VRGLWLSLRGGLPPRPTHLRADRRESPASSRHRVDCRRRRGRRIYGLAGYPKRPGGERRTPGPPRRRPPSTYQPGRARRPSALHPRGGAPARGAVHLPARRRQRLRALLGASTPADGRPPPLPHPLPRRHREERGPADESPRAASASRALSTTEHHGSTRRFARGCSRARGRRRRRRWPAIRCRRPRAV
jgi:hypothetical protein